MIFSSNQIEELKDYNLKQRQEIIAQAMQKLTVPQKLILNLIKLVLLIPPFIYLARQEWGMVIMTLLASIAGYLLILRPLSLSFIMKQIKEKVNLQ